MPRVVLIIVTHNSEKFLPELLLSLKRMQAPEGGMQTIFVDNASTDGTIDYLTTAIRQQAHGQGIALPLQLILNNQNLGFSAAVNAGIRHPLAQKAEYIALLNPDTVVTETWLIELVDVLDKDRNIASAQPLLLYDQDRGVVQSSGNQIHFLGFGFCDGNGKRFQLPASSFQLPEIAYASGAAVLYRRTALDEIGCFNEDLFMYHEDLDVGWKFLLKGYENILVPASIVYHHYEFSRSIRKYYWMERNRLMILLTHYRYRTLILLLPALIILECGLTLFSLIRGFFRARIQAYLWLVAHVVFLLKKHRQIQQLRKLPDSEVIKNFTGVISHQEVSNPIVEYVMNPAFSIYLSFIKSIIQW